MLNRQDAMITGGAEAVVTGFTLAGFHAMKALGKNDQLKPSEISRPFDELRSGFVMGEGAGILILENLEKAQKRGAKILAELVGFGASSDSYHIAAPHPEGIGAKASILNAIENAGIQINQIDYINAHGTSTPIGDEIEVKAVKDIFKEHAYQLKMSSTKGAIGHLLGAAGGIESVFCIKSILDQVAPPTINLEKTSANLDLNFVPNVAQPTKINFALNNTFGFGGTNSTLIFKKYN